MKTWQRWMVIGAVGALGAASSVRAQDYYVSSDGNRGHSDGAYDNMYPLYQAEEFNVDVFGSASLPGSTLRHLSGDRIEDNARLGVGAGASYFFLRNLGIGVDGYTENAEHSFIDSVTGNLIARLPIGESGFAPYIFGGGGRAFDLVEQWIGDAGVGIELRFKQRWGIFVDGRYTFPDKTDSYGVGRVGVRFAF